ncbi:MAG: DNA cytosine methyltransferase [Ignavibacterium album]|uniref:DNA cytosine methyltransferase n=1 Tax=Ignavibacterium album TaxID=591197 RepID=UPI0026EA31D0|nr:DNA cytosine methyltransferase [Ignavibacterium album]MCX8105944.1 DNA cytosine methyltransferase [Ignavibacterium album]
MKRLNYIDLFAGTSALSEGFRQLEFNPVAHIEMDKDACLTIKTREAYHHLKEIRKLDTYYKYISGNLTRDSLYKHIPLEKGFSVINAEISDSSLKQIFKTIENNLKHSSNSDIDLIVGGPPCQAYSLVGRHAIDWENDHRLKLYLYYGKFLKEYRPMAFVFENVPGLITAQNGWFLQNMKKYFAGIGYKVFDKILNAADYGVLQNRKRVFIVGWRKDFPFSFPDLEPFVHGHTVQDILSDLSPLTPGQVVNVGKYIKEPSDYLKQFQLCNGVDFYTQHISRPHNGNDLEIYKIAIQKWLNEKERLKYTDIPEKLRTQKNTYSFLDRFKVVDGKGLSHTIVAHIAKDGHYYIHPDIKQCRSISVREAARIQSFPDDFYFEGSRTSILRQIGNAVPPLLSSAIAKGIRKQFEKI